MGLGFLLDALSAYYLGTFFRERERREEVDFRWKDMRMHGSMGRFVGVTGGRRNV